MGPPPESRNFWEIALESRNFAWRKDSKKGTQIAGKREEREEIGAPAESERPKKWCSAAPAAGQQSEIQTWLLNKSYRIGIFKAKEQRSQKSNLGSKTTESLWYF